MTTEREKFEKWAKSYESVMSNRPIDSTEQLISYLDVQFGLDQTEDCWNSWQACAEQKQAEIDVLRAELEQVKVHNVMLADALYSIQLKVCGDAKPNWHNEEAIYHTRGVIADICEIRNSTSEQIESYKQELIAKAKEEQRESDAVLLQTTKEYKSYYMKDGQRKEIQHIMNMDTMKTIAEAIRNNKE